MHGTSHSMHNYLLPEGCIALIWKQIYFAMSTSLSYLPTLLKTESFIKAAVPRELQTC